MFCPIFFGYVYQVLSGACFSWWNEFSDSRNEIKFYWIAFLFLQTASFQSDNSNHGHAAVCECAVQLSYAPCKAHRPRTIRLGGKLQSHPWMVLRTAETPRSENIVSKTDNLTRNARRRNTLSVTAHRGHLSSLTATAVRYSLMWRHSDETRQFFGRDVIFSGAHFALSSLCTCVRTATTPSVAAEQGGSLASWLAGWLP